ncbi:MAG TPA: methyltransferase domain-containing protein [Albitalea sp.]
MSATTIEKVESHYARDADIPLRIAAALREAGKDPAFLAPADLAPVDEFHIRGRDATLELARRVAPRRGERVLDLGCGLGGSARFLAAEHGCAVTGIDLTHAYVAAARELTRWVGLDGGVAFEAADALSLPFDDASFDIVWSEHVQMNIGDKDRLYAEISRVLAPGGRLAFHDFLRGTGEPDFPVPWADDASISFLVEPQALREALARAGLRLAEWDDRTSLSADWLADRLSQPGPPPLGVHLLMGATARTKFDNVLRGLRDGRLRVVQAVALKADHG